MPGLVTVVGARRVPLVASILLHGGLIGAALHAAPLARSGSPVAPVPKEPVVFTLFDEERGATGGVGAGRAHGTAVPVRVRQVFRFAADDWSGE